jgi:DnaJ-class molecular chaperone
MYDQTGHTGEGSAAENNYNQGQGFNPEDIFGQFKGFNQRGGPQNMGNFEDILNDLFGGGGGFQQGRTRGQQHAFDNSPITMNLTLSFE